LVVIHYVSGIDTECFLNSTGVGKLISILQIENDCNINYSTIGTIDMKSHFNSECFSYDNTTSRDNMYFTKIDNTSIFIPIVLLLVSQLYIGFQVTKMSTCAFKPQHLDIYANITR
jgi:hypothetical protein